MTIECFLYYNIGIPTKNEKEKMKIQFNNIQFIKLSKNSNETTLVDNNAQFFYKATKKGVKFFDKDKNIFAYLAVHEGTPFFVSASDYDGKTRYMYSTTKTTEKMLGLENLTFRQGQDAAEKAKEAFFQIN